MSGIDPRVYSALAIGAFVVMSYSLGARMFLVTAPSAVVMFLAAWKRRDVGPRRAAE